MRTTPATRQFTEEALPERGPLRHPRSRPIRAQWGNRQAWHVTVVRDAATKQAIADLWEGLARRRITG